MKKYLSYLIVILVVIAAIVLWGRYHKAKKAPEWRLDVATTGNIREVVTATGSLNPYVLVNVGTEVSGKIEKIYKDYNDRVKVGDLLAKLDTELLRTSLDVAKGDLAKSITSMEEAKLDYGLLAELFKKGMTAEYDLKKAQFKYDTAQQNVTNARLSLQRAQKNLDNAFIKSPINGIIVSRDVDEGQTVAASLNSPTLFMIANNLDQMQITASVDEADIGKIRMGMPVEFTVDAHPTSNFEGSVQQIRLNPSSESNVVSYSVIIDAQNPERKLLPGMTTNVTFVIQAKENTLRIPEAATRFRPSKEVWELFGLKWDDEISNAGKKLIQESMQKAASKAEDNNNTNTPAVTKSVPDQPSKNKSVSQDSIRTKRQANSSSSNASSKGMRGKGQQGMMSQFGSGTRTRTSVVWVLEGKTPKPVAVKTGVSDGAFVEVVEGLEASAKIITGVVYKDTKQTANSAVTNTGPGMGRRF